ncbi:MAG: hypothetical protein SGJ09_17390 [Phycisphaerae bacterium]|nr:hypothetical protein [Phycisphaerae bacterium]
MSVRYVPDLSPERPVLGPGPTSAELKLGSLTNAAELRRCVTGAWALPQGFVLTRTADVAIDGSPRAIGYRVGRAATSAEKR